MQPYFDLGTYQRSVSTTSQDAATWFNRGLVWCYAFNHEEAVLCFEKAIDLDCNCAMANWGIAYATGPHYNKVWRRYGDKERPKAVALCHDYASQARALKHHASPLEQSLIEAMCRKHPTPEISEDNDYDTWMQDYADAMGRLHLEFPDDLDVTCLYAEALMNLTPWMLWDLQKGVPASNASTLRAIEMLEHGMALVAKGNLTPHPGLDHLYAHALEMSPTPEKAKGAADILRNICPDSGHLMHMASHIDALCGDWQAAVDANTRAIAVDRDYMEKRGSDGFYMILIMHNLDFKIWACMYLGQFEAALEAADSICALTRDKIFPRDEQYLNATLEGYHSNRAHVLVRFGKWQQICDEPMPEDEDLFLTTAIFMAYAKAIGFATLGDFETATKMQAKFEALCQKLPDWHEIANNPTCAVVDVARAMMQGEVEYHAGNHELGYKHLRRATELCDNLNYAEPWAWMHPPRHALGALLLEQGHVEEALTHYEDDLGIGNRLPRCVQHPGNIWALHGYHECLVRLDRVPEASALKPELKALANKADITISSSCLCRKHVQG